jgi:membrane associated rhomboid family serine protease
MQQWWRLVTPSFLHVGILHLLANGFCQLEAIALFEREWGSFRWLLIYLISSVGCSGMSTLFDPDTIAVGSSGALMGLYAAKLAQITTGICFNVSKDNAIRLDQLSSVLCGLTLVSMLSCFTYIDWSGHFGGLVSGFLSGMVLFSYPIKGCCSWFFWSLFGLAGLGATSAAVVNYLMLTYEPFEELGAVCDYFRSVFPETYECGCMNL